MGKLVIDSHRVNDLNAKLYEVTNWQYIKLRAQFWKWKKHNTMVRPILKLRRPNPLIKPLSKERRMNCPECNKPMRNLGNVSGVIFASYPPQWDITYVCDKDELKKTVRQRGATPEPQPNITNYTEITN
jgi:hypothetical protein